MFNRLAAGVQSQQSYFRIIVLKTITGILTLLLLDLVLYQRGGVDTTLLKGLS